MSVDRPQTPEEYLQLGIKHHEANRLEESVLCFERSAKEQGGCGVGMLMYGLSLRHGWGCPRNEKGGFHWLKKAAELAVTDLEKGKQGVDAMAIRVSFFENENEVIALKPLGSQNSSLLYTKWAKVFIKVGGFLKTRRWES